MMIYPSYWRDNGDGSWTKMIYEPEKRRKDGTPNPGYKASQYHWWDRSNGVAPHIRRRYTFGSSLYPTRPPTRPDS